MKRTLRRLVRITLTLFTLSAVTVAQKPSAGGASQAGQQSGQGTPSAPGGSGSGAGLQGLSYSPDEWPNLRLPDVKGPAFTYKNGRTVVCYRLAPGNSASQPFALVPLTKNEIKGSGFYRPCGDNSEGETDSIGQKTCRQNAQKAEKGKTADTDDGKEPIDPTHWSPCAELREQKDPLLMNQLLVIGVDVSDVGDLGINIDQLKLLNINVTNQQAGALNPSPIRPSFPATTTSGGGTGQGGSPGGSPDSSGKGAWWIPLGQKPPNGSYPQKWQANHPYHPGDVVSDSTGRSFYMANRGFTVGHPSGPTPTDPFPAEPRVDRILDGSVLWQELNNPKSTEQYDKSQFWQHHNQPIQKNNVVCVLKGQNSDNVQQMQLQVQVQLQLRMQLQLKQQLQIQQQLQQQQRQQLQRMQVPGELILANQIALASNDSEVRTEMQDGVANTNAATNSDMPPTCVVAEEQLRSIEQLRQKVMKSGPSAYDDLNVVQTVESFRIVSKLRTVDDVYRSLSEIGDFLKMTLEEELHRLQMDQEGVENATAELSEDQKKADAAQNTASADEKRISTDRKNRDEDQSKKDEAQLKEDSEQLSAARTTVAATENTLKQAQSDLTESRLKLDATREVVKTIISGLVQYSDGQHLRYYRALNNGNSGSVPEDPLSIALIPRAIYLQWPYELPGDVIPTFNVNLVYTPPTPGAPWHGNTFYPAGSVVVSSANSGHYYTALTGGFSDEERREPDLPIDVPPAIEDGSLTWVDAGTSVPSVPPASGASGGVSGQAPSGPGGGQGGGLGGGSAAGKPQQWLPNTHYLLGDVITNPSDGHYFTMTKSSAGLSGPAPAGGSTKDPFSPRTLPATLPDGELVWTLQTTLATPNMPEWIPGHHWLGENFRAGIYFYEMTSSTATTGSSAPDPFKTVNPNDVFPDGGLRWSDCTSKNVPVVIGCTSPNQPDTWKPDTPYGPHAAAMGFNNHRYYVSTGSGRSSPSIPVPVPNPQNPNHLVYDGDIIWFDSGPAVPGAPTWRGNQPYSIGKAVNASSRLYVMVGSAGSNSGASKPIITNSPGQPATVNDGDLLWMDAGTSQPGCTASWISNHPYQLNEKVYSAAGCEQYEMIRFTAGTSGPAPQSPFPPAGAGPSLTKILDGTILWIKSDQPASTDWLPNQSYPKNTTVHPPGNHSQAWIASNTGVSGSIPSQPNFPIVEASLTIEPEAVIEDPGDEIVWKDMGVLRPVGLPMGPLQQWHAGELYPYGTVIFVPGPGDGRYYMATGQSPSGSGRAGQTSPFLNVRAPLPVTWQDSGTTAPASVSSGPPVDQTVSLINLTLPQSHSLSYFNISFGVAVDFKRPPTFNFVSASSYVNNYHGKLPIGYVPAPGAISIPPASTVYGLDNATGCTITVPEIIPSPTPNTNYAYDCPVQTGTGARPVDPVLVLTLYVPPVDAERPMRLPKFNKGFEGIRDYIPAPSFGLSLSNPTTNFFLGASNELFIRNVQAFYGLTLHNIPLTLAPGSSQPIFGGGGTAPTVGTVTKFQKGFFLGVTFNLTGFVQSLFGGGSGGGAAK
jgi:hypothetical protein